MVIDIFSKYGWIIPLKSKTGIEVADAFNKIFKDRKCAKLWVDKGLEFYNKHVKALGVHLYSTENEEKSCVVERWNRTMKEKIKVRSEHNKLKFTIGDKVRIIKKKELFEKGYTPRWTEEVFTVSQIQYTDPPTYKITDYNGEEIQGTFYKQELQKTSQEIFRIEKVIKKQGNKSFVKWYGYPDTFNSWVNNTELKAI
ncbi:uncharacterized protein LOC136094570 [Hydra vulgaris]|uniref:uncharacterized protein LOC136094570 n=1 Tax=Hydra vulgaris TaxID=6087 RepID=UPI0032EA1B13